MGDGDLAGYKAEKFIKANSAMLSLCVFIKFHAGARQTCFNEGQGAAAKGPNPRAPDKILALIL